METLQKKFAFLINNELNPPQVPSATSLLRRILKEISGCMKTVLASFAFLCLFVCLLGVFLFLFVFGTEVILQEYIFFIFHWSQF